MRSSFNPAASAVLLLFFLLIAGCTAGTTQGNPANPRTVEGLNEAPAGVSAVSGLSGESGETGITANNAGQNCGELPFAVSLYKALHSRSGNLSFSPYSISSVLALAYEGARSATRQQMAETLHFPLDVEPFHRFYSKCRLSTEPGSLDKGVILNQGNALWGQKGCRFLPAFLKALKDGHASELRGLDFTRDAEGARKEINAWVEDRTKGIIKDIIKQGILTSDTRLVLTNAIHFKGLWAVQFSGKNTRPGPFRTHAGKTIQADFMDQSGSFKYLQTREVKLIEMPYAGGDLSMIMILPVEKGALNRIESSLSVHGIRDWLDELGRCTPALVHIRLPRFKAESEFELSKTLSGMGMAKAFLPDADFSGMTGSPELRIGNVIHKAYVEVNEEGTEAAAATAAVMVKSVREINEFFADHPFIFIIRDHGSGALLFMGRLADPGA